MKHYVLVRLEIFRPIWVAVFERPIDYFVMGVYCIKQDTSYIIKYAYQSEAKELLFQRQQKSKGLR